MFLHHCFARGGGGCEHRDKCSFPQPTPPRLPVRQVRGSRGGVIWAWTTPTHPLTPPHIKKTSQRKNGINTRRREYGAAFGHELLFWASVAPLTHPPQKWGTLPAKLLPVLNSSTGLSRRHCRGGTWHGSTDGGGTAIGTLPIAVPRAKGPQCGRVALAQFHRRPGRPCTADATAASGHTPARILTCRM